MRDARREQRVGRSQPSARFPVVVGAPEVRDQDSRGKSPTSTRLSAQIWTAEPGHDGPRRVRPRRLGLLRQRRGLRAPTPRPPNTVIPAAATEQTAFATVTGLTPGARLLRPLGGDERERADRARSPPASSAGGPGRDDARRHRHQLERGDAQRQRQPARQQHDGVLRGCDRRARCSARRTVTPGSPTTSAANLPAGAGVERRPDLGGRDRPSARRRATATGSYAYERQRDDLRRHDDLHDRAPRPPVAADGAAAAAERRRRYDRRHRPGGTTPPAHDHGRRRSPARSTRSPWR